MTLHSRIASVTRRPAAAVDDTVADSSRRWARRKAVHNNGQVLFDGITTPYTCLVRDISSTGAKIEMSRDKYNPDGSASFVPTHFTLIIPLDRTKMECQSVWRRGSLMGVRFTSAVSQLPPPVRSTISIGRKKK